MKASLPELPDADIYLIMKKRVIRRTRTESAEKLLEVDGCLETLDKSDKQDVKKMKEAREKLKDQTTLFKRQMREKKKEIKPGRAGSGGISKPKMPRNRALPSGNLTQAVLKQLLPPANPEKSYIWHNHVDSARRLGLLLGL